ncbi:MAG: hypothetical protein AABZ60_15020 [Planctomycetota bacterium]
MKIFGWILLVGSLIFCLGSELVGLFPIFSQGRPTTLLFSPIRAFLFSFEITLFLLWCGFWSIPQYSPLFYWETLPLRLISALSSLVPFSLLWKAELILLIGAYLPQKIHSYQEKILPYFMVMNWCFLLGPLVISYLSAELFHYPNQWFLWSPVLWLPNELGLLPTN